MLKKNKKFVYVLLDDDGTPLYVSKSIRKINKFLGVLRERFRGETSITTLDEYNKTHSEEAIIDDMFKEWMKSRGNK